MAGAGEFNICFRRTKLTKGLLRKVEKKPMNQWERFSNFNRLVNTMAYVQRVFKKHKPATRTLNVEEREGAQASIFRLLQQEQFAEEMKSQG